MKFGQKHLELGVGSRDATVVEGCYGRDARRDSEVRIVDSPLSRQKTRVVKYLRVRQGFDPNMLGIHPELICKQGCCDPVFCELSDVFVAPETDMISRKKCTPTVALLDYKK